MSLTTPDTTFWAKSDTRFRLRGEPENVVMTRELTDVTLTSWALPHLIPDAKLIVAELFTNALRVARHLDLFLCLSREDETVCLGVWDPSPLMPVMGRCDPSKTSGRGLSIVAALTDTHGCHSVGTPPGKVVWARMKF